MNITILYALPFFILCQFILCQAFVKERLKTCDEGMWRLVHNDSNLSGHAKLRFKIQKGYESGSYDAILACSELVVHGTGSKVVTVSKWKSTHVHFGVIVPKSRFQDKERDTISNQCSFELRRRATESTQREVVKSCEFTLLSVLARIVPHCSDTDKRGDELLKYIQVKREQGIVHIYFKTSPNDIALVKHYCKNNPLKNSILFDNDLDREGVLVNLDSFGGTERIYAVNFYPDCDNFNASIRKLFMTKENHDCYVAIYAKCQEGMTLIKSFDVDLDRESMMCSAPKSTFTRTIESAKLKFRIENDVIAALLIIMCINFILYLLILPCLMTICIREVIKVGKRFQESHKKFDGGGKGGGRNKNQKRKKSSVSKKKGSQSPGPTTHLMENIDGDDGDIFVAGQSAKEQQAEEKQEEELKQAEQKDQGKVKEVKEKQKHHEKKKHHEKHTEAQFPGLDNYSGGLAASRASDIVIQLTGPEKKEGNLIDFGDDSLLPPTQPEPFPTIPLEELEETMYIKDLGLFSPPRPQTHLIPPLDTNLVKPGEPLDSPKSTIISLKDTKAQWVSHFGQEEKPKDTKPHKHKSHKKESQDKGKAHHHHHRHHHSKQKKENKLATVDNVEPDTIMLQHDFDEEMVEIEKLLEGFSKKKTDGQGAPPNQQGARPMQQMQGMSVRPRQGMMFQQPGLPPGVAGPVRFGDPRQAMMYQQQPRVPMYGQPGMFSGARSPQQQQQWPMQGASPTPIGFNSAGQPIFANQQSPPPRMPQQMYGDPRMMYQQQPPSPRAIQQSPMRFVDPNQAMMFARQSIQPRPMLPGLPPMVPQPIPQRMPLQPMQQQPLRYPPSLPPPPPKAEEEQDDSEPDEEEEDEEKEEVIASTPPKAAMKKTNSQTGRLKGEKEEEKVIASNPPKAAMKKTNSQTGRLKGEKEEEYLMATSPRKTRTTSLTGRLAYSPPKAAMKRTTSQTGRLKSESKTAVKVESKSREHEDEHLTPTTSKKAFKETTSDTTGMAGMFVSPVSKSFHSLKEQLDSKYTLGHEDVDVNLIDKWCSEVNVGAPPPTRRVRRSMVQSSIGTIPFPDCFQQPSPTPTPSPPTRTHSARAPQESRTEMNERKANDERRRSSSADELQMPIRRIQSGREQDHVESGLRRRRKDNWKQDHDGQKEEDEGRSEERKEGQLDRRKRQSKPKARPARYPSTRRYQWVSPGPGPAITSQACSMSASTDDFDVPYTSLQPPREGNPYPVVEIKRLSSSSSSLLETKETDNESVQQNIVPPKEFHETIAIEEDSNTPVSPCSVSMMALCDSSSFHQEMIHHASSASGIGLSCNTEESIFPISSSPRSPDSCLSLPPTLPSYPVSSSQQEEESQSDDNINYHLV